MKIRVAWLVAGIAFAACHKVEQDEGVEDRANQRSRLEAEARSKEAEARAKSEPLKGPSADSMQLAHDLGKMPIPENNPTTPEKVELGHDLFFDKRLSVDGSRACYSCHQNEDGNGGKDPIAIGAKDKVLTRHSPVIWNVGYLPRLYWDGRASSLEEQGLGALGGGNMGVGKENIEKKAQEIGKIPGYKKLFEKAFPGKGATPETVSQALAAYQRTLVCDDTAFDKFAKGDKKALSDPQKRGLELFMGKAACVTCHAPPFFSIAQLGQGAFFDVGIGIEGKKDEEIDTGRMAITKSDTDYAAFKPPSLRNVSKSAPYFHDGSRKTLEEAVRFMAGGGFKNKNLTPLLTDKHLSDKEIASILEFLKALDCNKTLEPPKKLP